MTMPKRPVKPVKVPKPPKLLPPTEGIPPELQVYLDQVDQTQGWGGQLTLLTFLSYWNQTNPQGLYETRLIDYLRNKYNRERRALEAEYSKNIAEGAPPDNAAEDYRDKTAKLRKSINDVSQTVEWYKKLGQPLEEMPYYKEISALPQSEADFGPGVQNAFNQFKTQRNLEAQAFNQEQAAYAEKAKAFYRPYETQPAYGGGETSAAAIAEQQRLQPTLVKSAQQIAEWQAAQEKPWQRTMRANPGMTEEQAKQITPLPQQNQALNNAVAARAAQEQGALRTQSIYNNLARQSKILASQFPQQYQDWATQYQQGYIGKGPAGGVAGSPPPGWEGTFANWALAKENPEQPLTQQQKTFQQQMRDQELGNWRTYGDIYGGYQDYLNSADETQIKPIDQWIKETPQASLAWEQRQASLQPRRQPYAQWR